MKSIFLSAGHSETDSGAVAFGRKEADICEDFRNIVSHCLHDLRVPHTVDGRGAENQPLRDAVKLVAMHNIALEFHCNASGSPSATGVETLSAPSDMYLGSRICAVIADVWGIRNRGAKPENSGQHHRLAFVSQGGGIIVELFFLTNANDLRAYDTKKWPAARALAALLADIAGQ